jgi:antitoxin MazE
MEAVIKKWGNSLALRLPKTLADHYGIKDGGHIEISLEKDYIKIKPIGKLKISLKDLLSKITDENKHNEIDWGFAVGNEIINELIENKVNKQQKNNSGKKKLLKDLLLKAPTISNEEYNEFIAEREHFNRGFNADN